MSLRFGTHDKDLAIAKRWDVNGCIGDVPLAFWQVSSAGRFWPSAFPVARVNEGHHCTGFWPVYLSDVTE